MTRTTKRNMQSFNITVWKRQDRTTNIHAQRSLVDPRSMQRRESCDAVFALKKTWVPRSLKRDKWSLSSYLLPPSGGAVARWRMEAMAWRRCTPRGRRSLAAEECANAKARRWAVVEYTWILYVNTRCEGRVRKAIDPCNHSESTTNEWFFKTNS